MRRMSAGQVIKLLNLKPLEFEGGYFSETYRSQTSITVGRRGKRAHGTAIYFLLTPGRFSAIHRLKSDEMFLLGPKTHGHRVLLGPDIQHGQRPQIVVPRGFWQGARLMPGGAWTLLGTTVAPGFDRRDFELGVRHRLLRQFPTQAKMIIALTGE